MSFRTGMRMVRKLKRYGGRGRRRAPIAVKALKKVNALRKQIGKPEVKHSFASNSSYVQVSNDGYTTVLGTTIPQDTSITGRIGDQIHMKSFRMKYQWVNPAGFSDNLVRVVVVLDKYAKGHSLIDVNTATGTYLAISAPLEPELFGPGKDYQLLYDKVHTFGTQDSSSNAVLWRQIFKKINKMRQFDLNTTTNKNNVFRLYCWSNINTADPGEPSILIQTDLRYTDV